MDKLNRAWPVFLVVLLVGLAVRFPGLLFNTLLKPIAVFLWAAWRLVLTVDQSTYWLILIALSCILMVRFLSAAQRRPARPAYTYSLSPANRVEAWRAMMDQAVTQGGENTDLRDSLGKLVFSAVSTSRRLASTDLRATIEAGEIALPPGVAQYLFPEPGKQGLIQHFIPGSKRFKKWKRNISPAELASIDEVLRWAENYLEIQHDR